MRALALILLATPAWAQDPVIPRFSDDTPTAGLATPYQGDWEFMVGGGVATFDCNGDQRPDIFLPGGQGPSGLYRNDSTVDALRFSPLSLPIDMATGAYPIDIDSDGLTDLVVLRVGPDQILRGTGNCAFEPANDLWAFDGGDDWTAAFAATWERGATWPTLAFGSYIDRREDLFPWGSCTPNRLFRPDGDTFGAPILLDPSHCALSMLFTDWDRSGTVALRISNDREYYKGGEEQLWHLPPGATPALYTMAEGWARLRIWGMGIAARDLTGDGRMDYFLTSMADNKLQVLRDGASGPVYDDIAYVRGVTAHRPYVATTRIRRPPGTRSSKM
jgi:enediyne biosynthesis protein E4